MDVLVKGMKMPKSCGRCPMMRPGNYKGQAFPCTCHAKDCFPIKPSELDLRDGLCSLIEVPSADVEGMLCISEEEYNTMSKAMLVVMYLKDVQNMLGEFEV